MKWNTVIFTVLMLFLISCEGAMESANQETHLIKKGETIFSVAQHYDIGIAEIKSLNPKLKDDLSGWKAGVEIILPLESSTEVTMQGKEESPSGSTHLIKKGETIFSVSQHYDIRIAEIKSLNPKLKDDLSGWKVGVEIILSSESIHPIPNN
jgi:LysM repeat protein